jgi:hypothetical protein
MQTTSLVTANALHPADALAFSRVHEPDDHIGVGLGKADGAWGDRLSAHLPRSRFVPDDLEPGGALGGWNVPSAPFDDFSVG